MQKRKKTLLTIAGFVLLGTLAYVGYSARFQNTSRWEESPQKLKGDADRFSEVAMRFHRNDLDSYCKKGKEWYSVNGDHYKLGSNEFIGTGKTTFNNLLERDKITREEFEYYRTFIEANNFIDCIKRELNIKVNNGTVTTYAVVFEIDSLNGFLYSSDGSLQENTNINYRDKVYKTFERIPETNWYKFTYKNEYGT